MYGAVSSARTKKIGWARGIAVALACATLAVVSLNANHAKPFTTQLTTSGPSHPLREVLEGLVPVGTSPREVWKEIVQRVENYVPNNKTGGASGTGQTSGLGFDPAPSFPDKSEMTLQDWRSLVPGPHHMINGRVPPGIPVGTNSTILDLEKIDGTCFVTWHIPGRPVGYRTPIHVHPRPQEVCVTRGAVLTMIEGREDTVNSAGECFLMPQMTKMANLAIGTNETEDQATGYEDFDVFRVPIWEPEWVVIEPDHLDLQGAQFVREDGCMKEVQMM